MVQKKPFFRYLPKYPCLFEFCFRPQLHWKLMDILVNFTKNETFCKNLILFRVFELAKIAKYLVISKKKFLPIELGQHEFGSIKNEVTIFDK